MIYLDSAATSLIKPAAVEQAMVYALRNLASPGRGGHKPSFDAARLVYECREAAAALFNAKEPENVVFTFNATHGLNIAIRHFAARGTKVLVSGYEHNSVSRPLNALGAEIMEAGRELFDREQAVRDFENKIKDAELVVCSHVSNVFGYILPVYEIGEMCRKRGIPYIVDASQSAGLLDLDMKALKASCVAMPGHKGLMGPQGTGLLLCSEAFRPLLYGGSGSDSLLQTMPAYLPDRLEAGTHNVCGIAGLLAGIKFVREKGLSAIFRHERMLMELMIEELKDTKLRLFFSHAGVQAPVLSLVPENMDCESLAAALGEMNVCVRAGLHCAPSAHRSARTEATGTLRLSFSPFLTVQQIKEAAAIIKHIVN